MSSGTRSTSSPDEEDTSGQVSEPNLKQQDILRAFAEEPNAAAVGRLLGTNEAHVRRVVKKYPMHLRDARRQVLRERQEQKQARESRLESWAADKIEGLLERLDSLGASANEAVALRAIKLQLEVVMQIRRTPIADTLLVLADAESRLLDPLADTEPRDDVPSGATND